MERNEWFQDRVVKWLNRHGPKLETADGPPVVFAYSYAARRILAWAQTHGWRTVLGQIDPGPEEQAIVAELNQRYPEWAASTGRLAPKEYWDQWRIECELADRIMVNSQWSANLLARAEIPTEKIRVVPLAYEVGGGKSEVGSRRSEVGSRRSEVGSRKSEVGGRKAEGGGRLRVLFLGQAILRKGIQDLVAAARMLDQTPVDFDVVGPYGKLPSDVPPNVTFHGPTERGRVSQWYQAADVFVLPTHSDGFALTQLEAMAYGVPVIATPCCGDVVQPDINGWIIAADAPHELAERLRSLAEDPGQLDDMTNACRRRAEEFSVTRLGDRLMELF